MRDKKCGIPKKGQEPLAQNVIDDLLQFIKLHELQKARLAREIGINRSTFNDILEGRNVLRKNKDLILKFVNEKMINYNSKTSLSDVSLPSVSGTDNPLIGSKRFDLLVVSGKMTSDQLISVLKEIVNAGEGDRREIRKALGSELFDLRVLTRALASEVALKQVQDELGKKDLP